MHAFAGRLWERGGEWDGAGGRDGDFVAEVANLPLAEDIPIAFSSCRKGPRGLDWRDDEPSQLYWLEAQVLLPPSPATVFAHVGP